MKYLFLVFSMVLSISLFPQSANKDSVYTNPDTMPEYPGGEDALMKFIKTNLVYPNIPDTESEIRTRLVLGFVVNEDGSVSDIKVIRSMLPSFDTEAIRVVKLFPKFKPGREGDVPVRVRFVIPMIFETFHQN